MEAGKLLNKITFLKKIKVKSESGGTVNKEVEILKSRFSDYTIAGETKEEASEIQYNLNRVILMRYNKLITKDCVCIIDDEKYKINALIINKHRNKIKLYLKSIDQ